MTRFHFAIFVVFCWLTIIELINYIWVTDRMQVKRVMCISLWIFTLSTSLWHNLFIVRVFYMSRCCAVHSIWAKYMVLCAKYCFVLVYVCDVAWWIFKSILLKKENENQNKEIIFWYLETDLKSRWRGESQFIILVSFERWRN